METGYTRCKQSGCAVFRVRAIEDEARDVRKVSKMEVPVMKKLLHKDLLPVSMLQENVLEKSQLSLIVRRDMLVF